MFSNHKIGTVYIDIFPPVCSNKSYHDMAEGLRGHDDGHFETWDASTVISSVWWFQIVEAKKHLKTSLCRSKGSKGFDDPSAQSGIPKPPQKAWVVKNIGGWGKKCDQHLANWSKFGESLNLSLVTMSFLMIGKQFYKSPSPATTWGNTARSRSVYDNFHDDDDDDHHHHHHQQQQHQHQSFCINIYIYIILSYHISTIHITTIWLSSFHEPWTILNHLKTTEKWVTLGRPNFTNTERQLSGVVTEVAGT